MKTFSQGGAAKIKSEQFSEIGSWTNKQLLLTRSSSCSENLIALCLKSVQILEAVKMLLLAPSEATVRLSLPVYRWKDLPVQNMNKKKYFN